MECNNRLTEASHELKDSKPLPGGISTIKAGQYALFELRERKSGQ